VDQKLRQERFVSALNEARQIQMSILPKRAPQAGPFEMSGFTAPAEIVGGDFFDFIPECERIGGVAFADASGHGLPAALQVRDVYTGLRMGVARDFKIVRTVERLNRIIHQSRMTTKFVSLFYGEIEEEGNFIYVNAGHPPPLHFHAKGVTTLKQTGMVLGPSGTSAYSRGFLAFQKGDALLLYTDGMIEATDGKGKEFGIERLKKLFLTLWDRPAAEITRALIERLSEFTQGRPPEDDRTVVVVKYLTGGMTVPLPRTTDGAPKPASPRATDGTPKVG
jgi:phosphoserine phosphatase RsbU/P